MSYAPQVAGVSLLAALNAADMATTWVGLRMGMTEKNPLVKRHMKLAALVKIGTSVGIVVLYQHFHGLLFLALLGLDVRYMFVVAGNTWAIRKVARGEREPW